jgi:hypothetical protein
LPKCLYQISGLAPELKVDFQKVLDPLVESRVGAYSFLLKFVQLCLESRQAVLYPTNKFIHGLAAYLKIHLGPLMKALQILRCELQEGLVIQLQRLGRDCSEGVL